MNTDGRSGTRSIPRAASIAKALAGVVGAATLAAVYPVAAALATAMATSLRVEMPKPAAAIVVSAGAAERNSLGLRFVLSNPIRQE